MNEAFRQDVGQLVGLTRDMLAQQREGQSTRADQDSSWRRRGPAADATPTNSGGGASSIRSMMGAPRGGETGGSASSIRNMMGAPRGGSTPIGGPGPAPMGSQSRADAMRGGAPPPAPTERRSALESRGMMSNNMGAAAPMGRSALESRGMASLAAPAPTERRSAMESRGMNLGTTPAPPMGRSALESRGMVSLAAEREPVTADRRPPMMEPPSTRGGMASSMDPRLAQNNNNNNMSAPPSRFAEAPQGPPAAAPRGSADQGGMGYRTKADAFSGTFAAPAKGVMATTMAPPVATEKAAAEPTDPQEGVPLRTLDLYWQAYPQDKVWVRKSRRETVRETRSRMPVVLRNLAPDTVFDPCIMWEKEKERIELEKAKLRESSAAAAAAAKKGSKGAQSGGKAKKPSKKDEMIGKNKKDTEDREIRADLEKLENAAKSCRNRAVLGATILATKCATSLGKLRQLFLVLDVELKNENTPVIFDVLWAIEDSKLYLEALNQLADEEGDDEGTTKDKKKKDDKKKKKDELGDKKPAKKSQEAAQCHEFRKELRAAQKLRKELRKELASFQLERMYDRLPPLSPFLKGWRLDDWQKRVLHHVDAQRSAIVCAPTSSGKTVISTYTCVNYKKVLFCVPTEPLVWQVAAMFEKLLQGSAQVALVTNQLAYRPSEDSSRVIVGTPLALESALVKIRGKVGDEVVKRWDYAQLEGGFDFDYAVFDEVHALDGEEGAALQRLVRAVGCPTLALSATIGNAKELQDWWQSVRDDVTLVDASTTDAAAAQKDDVVLVEHTGRFINVQNLVLDPKNKLQRLHPVAALTSKQLVATGADKVAFALTPADASNLFKALKAEYGAAVADLDPETFFPALAAEAEAEYVAKIEARNARLGLAAASAESDKAREAGVSVRARTTLDRAKQYESALKLKLEELACADAARVERTILEPFVPEQLRKTLSTDDEASAPTPSFSMLAAASDMRTKALFPSLAFHLDSFRCLALFKSLLAELETAQETKYPTWADDLAEKALLAAKDAESRAKSKERNAKEAEEEAKEGLVDEGSAFVDVTAPHPEFILATPNARLSAKEIDDILKELKEDNQNKELPASHILVRALRRGFGLYIDDAAFAVYRRVVQRLAQQGKLAIVFSDVSLAYGVNMPFRTVVFCGDEGNLLTPLLAQQMAGRAGRRGLDTQGNLVYLGMSWPRIRRLMVGTVPAIEGKPPQFVTMALPLVLSSEVWDDDAHPPLSKFVPRDVMRRLCAASLAEYRAGVRRSAADADSRVEWYLTTLKKLGLWSTSATAPAAADKKRVDTRPLLCAVWELRDYLPESLAFSFALPHLMTDFVKNRYNFKRATDDAGSEAVQLEFFAVLLHIIDRTPCALGNTALGECSYIRKAPERVAKWDRWEALLVESQERLDALPLHDGNQAEIDALKLKVPPGAPLDGAVFEVCKDRKMPAPGAISSLERHKLKQRIWHVGNILMKAHNCLQLPGEFIALSPLLRKCCQRIKYILSDDISANVDENIIIDTHDSDEDENNDQGPPEDATVEDATAAPA